MHREDRQMLGALGAIAAFLILLIVLMFQRDVNICNTLLAESRTHTDTLVVVSGERCSFTVKRVLGKG